MKTDRDMGEASAIPPGEENHMEVESAFEGDDMPSPKLKRTSFFSFCRNCVSPYMLGVLLILCVTVIWVGSSVWIQQIFGNQGFNKPYFLTYFNTTGFCFWNFGFLVSKRWRRIPWTDKGLDQPVLVEDVTVVRAETPSCSAPSDDNVCGNGSERKETTPPKGETVCLNEPYRDESEKHPSKCACPPCLRCFSDDASVNSDMEEWVEVPAKDGQGSDEAFPGVVVRLRRERIRPYSILKVWRCALLFCPLWFIANYLFNLSLSYSSVASTTILSSTSSVWTLLLSFLFLREPIRFHQWLAVAMSFGGSIMVGLSDSVRGQADHPVVDNLVAASSAFFYATYTTTLKYCLPDDERYYMGVMFGAVGCINLLLWPGLPILDAIGFEPFTWPTGTQFGSLLLNALIGTNLSDVLWARSVVLTSPVVATVGLSLTIPLAMLLDLAMKVRNFPPLYTGGAVLVTLGFITSHLPLKDMLAYIITFRNPFKPK